MVGLCLVGPAFTPPQRTFLADVGRALDAAGISCVTIPDDGRQGSFGHLLEALQGAETLVMVLDGPDVTSGVACAMGIFIGLERPTRQPRRVVGILTDHRPLSRTRAGSPEGLNLFIEGCVGSMGTIASSIPETVRLLRGQHAS